MFDLIYDCIITFLFAIRPRPATSSAMAKRLVSTALGIKNTVSPEQRKMERQMLADAKGNLLILFQYTDFYIFLLSCVVLAKKRLAAHQREAAWDGQFTDP